MIKIWYHHPSSSEPAHPLTQTEARVYMTPPPPKRVPWSQHTLRQLKLVLPGAAITYYLGTFHEFLLIFNGGGSWGRLVLFFVGTHSGVTIIDFIQNRSAGCRYPRFHDHCAVYLRSYDALDNWRRT